MDSEPQITKKSLTIKQRGFVAILFILGLLLSFLIVRFVDPSAALGVSERRCPPVSVSLA